MSKAVSCEIPYDPQRDKRTCGAAALCMVYRSFGLACTQSEIWERIARPGPWELERTNTRLLSADALSCGLAALILRARDPWRVLESSMGRGIRIVVNHRLTPTSQAGHYTVLVGMDGEDVVLHDPHLGPFRHLTRAELLELWRPSFGQSEITGQVLVAFANAPASALVCESCGANIPESAACVNCQKAIPLQPGAVLGCVKAACRARTWEQIFCPHCDMGLYHVTGRQADNPGWDRFASLGDRANSTDTVAAMSPELGTRFSQQVEVRRYGGRSEPGRQS